jgi:YVTN family beta-propeller protein
VPNDGSNNVSVIDTASNTVTATIAVQANPRGVAITPDGAFAYVSNRIANTVSVVNTATNSVVATVMGVALFPEAVILPAR